MAEKEKHKLDVVAIRMIKEQPIYSDIPITAPIDAVRLVGNKLCEYDRECTAVICLKANGIPICCSICSIGSLDASFVHPREMLKAAILANASRIIMVHNHPSGSLVPSKDDTRVTDRMIQICDLVGIPLVDHIIVSGKNEEYFSFREKAVLKMPNVVYETDYRDIHFPKLSVAESGKENKSLKHH